jgi:LmeA-like phospholipid-binding
MEFLTILLSSLLGLTIPAGMVIEQTATSRIRSQFAKIEDLQVRIDNLPTHQLLQGKINRVRIAGRSLQLKHQDIYITALELETDAIELNIHKAKTSLVVAQRDLSNNHTQKQSLLKQPLQVGLKLVLSENDINKLLQSPEFLALLSKLNIVSVDAENMGSHPVYHFYNPRVKFVANQRINLWVEIREQGKSQGLQLIVETGVNVIAGRQFQLVNPVIKVNQEAVPTQLIDAIVKNLNRSLDLANLETNGLTVRILQLNIKENTLEIASFFRIEPSSKVLEAVKL